ncbi:MAG: glycosyltransferase [Candidatus Aureabacteria bacterium]|nr:glycosyltransferase [Candidatus Auribacterota bacterium]
MRNKSKPRVSVIIPNYNYARFLPECIESVIAQTYKNWELIVVDDNSTDKSREVVKKYIKKHPNLNIRLIHNKKGPSGTPTPVNIGINNMKGEYFAWLSSDDIFKPDKLEKQVDVLEKEPEVGFVHTGFDIIDDCGSVTKMHFPDYNALSKIDFMLLFLDHNLINGSTVLIRKSIFDIVGLFDESWTSCPQIWMVTEVLKWFEISLESKIHFIKENLHKARVHKAKGPVYKSDLPVTLMGIIIEHFLKNYRLDNLYKKLGGVNNNLIEFIETKIGLVLSKYNRYLYIVKRLEQMNKYNNKIFNKIITNLKEVDRLNLISKLAVLYILKNKDVKKILFYKIKKKYLKYLNGFQLYNIASAFKKAGGYKTSKMLFSEIERRVYIEESYKSGAFYHLGEISMQLKEQSNAKKYFSKCLKISPKHKKAKKYIKAI